MVENCKKGKKLEPSHLKAAWEKDSTQILAMENPTLSFPDFTKP